MRAPAHPVAAGAEGHCREGGEGAGPAQAGLHAHPGQPAGLGSRGPGGAGLDCGGIGGRPDLRLHRPGSFRPGHRHIQGGFAGPREFLPHSGGVFHHPGEAEGRQADRQAGVGGCRQRLPPGSGWFWNQRHGPKPAAGFPGAHGGRAASVGVSGDVGNRRQDLPCARPASQSRDFRIGPAGIRSPASQAAGGRESLRKCRCESPTISGAGTPWTG